MVHLQRMAKRHPGLRSFLAVLLSIAMVLNSVPAAAFAEEVNELQEVIGMAEPEAQPEEEATEDELVAEASEEAPSEEALPEEAAPTEEADVEAAPTEEADVEAASEEANLDAPVAPAVATKRTYTYEDAAVKVTATLEKADAIPDAAELKVTAVTEESEDYNYAAYMGALNKGFEGMDAYTAENTLLYDVAFLVADESGNTVEVEPESGSVKFKLEFKKNQLSENISAEDADSVQLIHLPLKEDVRDVYDTTAQAVEIEASDVLVEGIDANLTVGNKEDASFVLDSLSIIAASTHPDSFGPTDQTNSQVNFSLALGRAVEYGIVADTYNQKNHQQTNFAVKKYKNSNGIDGEPDLAGTWTVPYQIGSILDNTKLRFGQTTYQGEEVQYDVYLPKSYEEHIDDYVTIDGGGKKIVNFVYEDNNTINSNVASMLSSANEKSQTLASHATTVDLSNSVVTDQNQLVIDTTSYPDDAVIYLNVPDDPDYSMIRTVLEHQSALHLHKKANQVIVLNVLGKAPVDIKKYIVTLPGEPKDATADDYATVSPSGQNSPLNVRIDEQIAQKVIWNFPNASKVTMNSSAGVFLVPNGDVDVTGTSAGWIVSGGTVTTDGCEFHFIYRDRHYTPQTPSDGPQRSLRFTAYKGMKDANGKEIGLGGRQFPFSLYETDSTFAVADSATPIETVDSNLANVNFTAIKFTEEMIAAHENGDFYYVIKEDQGGSTVNGVTNWDGQINAKLHAEVQGDSIVFKMTYYRYLTGEDMSKGNTDNTVRTIDVSGEEFTFGRVFNFYNAKTDVTLGAKKTLDGDEPEAGAFEFVLTEVADANGTAITPAEGETVYTDTKKNDGTGSVTFDKIEYTAADAAAAPEGKKHYYKITETNAGNQSLKYDATEHIVTVTVTDDGQGNLTATADKSANDVVFKNTTRTGDLKVTKTFGGDVTPEEIAKGSIKITVAKKDAEGNVVGYLDKDGKLSESRVVLTLGTDDGFESSDDGKTWTKSFTGVAIGNYEVTETNYELDGLTFKEDKSTTSDSTTVTEETVKDKAATADLVDFYEQKKGSLTITKEWAGDLPEDKRPEVTFRVSGPTGFKTQTKKLSEFTEGAWTLTDLEDGTYTVTETGADVTGYDLETTYSVKDGEATITKASDESVTVTNKYDKIVGKLTVTKTVAGINLVEDPASYVASIATVFKVTVKNADNLYLQANGSFASEVHEFDLTVATPLSFDNLPLGTYTVTETANGTIAGYVFQNVKAAPESGTGTIAKMGDEAEVKLTNTYKQNSVKVSKTDATGQEELAGATIQILNKDEEVVAEWISTDKPHEVKGLATGEYTLRETVAPDGYTIATDTTFTINEDGTVDAGESMSEDGVILIKDSLTKVTVSKKAVDGGSAELEGAKIQIIDKATGKVVVLNEGTDDQETLEWTSGKTAKEISGLTAGKTYILHEDLAPAGYAVATDIEFTIDTDGKVKTGDKVAENGVLVINDALTEVRISKVDVADSKEVAGATIQILDSKGNVAKDKDGNSLEWTSTEEAKVITGLKADETYTLHEKTAPDGYVLSSDTTFTIAKDGTVTTKGNTTTDEDGNTVLLVEDDQTVVRISKIDVADSSELEGAQIEIQDAAGNVVKINGEDVKWTSDGETHTVTGLKTDTEYVLVETVAPDGYTITSKTTFTIDSKTGNVKTKGSVTVDDEGNVVVLVEDSKTEVRVSKVDATSQVEVKGAHIQILDDKGIVKDEWDSDGKSAHVTKGLKTGATYTLKETVAPDGYKIASETTFSIATDGSLVTKGATTTDADGKTVLLVEDTKTSVKVSKVDIAGGEELAGAKIQIIDSKGDVVEEWTSAVDDEETKDVNEAVHEIEGLKTGETYTLRETVAPDGYTIATDTKFTLNADGTVSVDADADDAATFEDGVLLVEDTKTSVKVSKVDIADGEEVEGATIQILDKDGKIVEEWVSGKEAHEIEGLKTGETYTLRETVAPEGYTVATDTTFSIDEKGKVTTTGSITKDGILLVEDAKTSVKVSKVDIADGEEIAGAKIQILDSKGNVVEEWTSAVDDEETKDVNEAIHEIEGLKTDETYTLRETVAPDGYTIATDTTFTIDTKGNVTTTGSKTEDGVMLVEDALTKVKVSKTDIADGEELAGAHIQILDKDGNVVEEWVSGKDAHEITGLKTGVEYTLRETVAPDGYTIATDTTFTIDTKGNVTTTGSKTEDGILLVEDSLTKVKVSKSDIADGEELAGATIQIIDSKGDVVEEWTSAVDDEETKDVNEAIHEIEGLKTGETYTLRETVAPDGYTIATDTTFSIDEKGNVTTTGTITEDGVLLVEDSLTTVSISKTDIASGDELEGATIQLFDKDGNMVEEWVSTKDTHTITGLKTGETYTLRETVAPDGYTIATDTTFSIDEKGKVTSSGTVTKDGIVLVEDALTTVSISKTDIASGDEVEGASIQILDADGKVVEEWKSGKTAHVVKGLKTGVEYTLRETVAPDGYAVTTDTTFTIDEKGKVTTTGSKTEDGTVLVQDAKTSVKVSKTDIANGKELEGATIQVLDKDGNVVEEWVSGKEVHEIRGLKTGVQYTLKETVAPDGYTIAAETNFSLTASGKVITEGTITEDGVLLVEDSLTKVKVSKTDIAGGEELAGAKIQIIDSKGNVVEEWTSVADDEKTKVVNEGVHEIEGLKTGETYTLRETVAPDGYTIATDTTFTIDENGKVTTTGTITEDGVLLVEDAMTKVKVSKTDIADGAEVEGATIQVLDKDGKVVEEWVSGKTAHTITGLKTGETYTLRETVAPDGYAVTTDITFTIDEKGKVTTKAKVAEDGTILVEDTRLAGPATISLKKDVKTNIPWAATEDFEFTLATEDGTPIEAIKVKAGEEKSFKALNIDRPGTHYYTITETKGSTLHVTYDTATKWAKVEAVSNAKDGRLDCTVKYGDSKDACTKDALVITNEYAAPALEKYINKDVHQDLPAFDTPFTYDILAFVTRDANSVVITDPLIKGVRFLDGDNTTVTVQDIGPDNDHTAHGTVEKAAGTDVVAESVVDSAAKTLTVTIPDATEHRGHWVRVTYRVALDNHVVNDTPEYIENDVDIDTNGTVISPTYPTHDGVETYASYIVHADNGNYDLVANHITVTPPTETFKVSKKWTDANGKAVAWPKDAKVTVELYGNGKPLDQATTELMGADKALGRMIVELDASKTSATFAALPVYEAIEYTVVETAVTNVSEGFVASTSGNKTDGFVVTNKFNEKKEEKKQEQKKTTTSTATTSGSKLAKTGDPMAAAGLATLWLSGIGSALATGGAIIRKRRRDENDKH